MYVYYKVVAWSKVGDLFEESWGGFSPKSPLQNRNYRRTFRNDTAMKPIRPYPKICGSKEIFYFLTANADCRHVVSQ